MTDLVPHHIRPPETWLAARDDYLAGLPAELVAERYGVSLSSVRTHARVEGWRRTDHPLAALPPPDDPLTDEDEALDPEEMIELAHRHAARAVRRGRAAEADRWTRLAERWEKLAVPGVRAADLDHLARLARTAQAVAREDADSGALIGDAMRRRVARAFAPARRRPAAPDLHGPHGPSKTAALAPAGHLHGLHDGVSAIALAAAAPAARGSPCPSTPSP